MRGIAAEGLRPCSSQTQPHAEFPTAGDGLYCAIALAAHFICLAHAYGHCHRAWAILLAPWLDWVTKEDHPQSP